MRKLILIVDSFNTVYATTKRGGGSIVAKNLIGQLAKTNDIELTIFVGKSEPKDLDGVHEIIISKYHHFEEGFFKEFETINQGKKYDFVLTANLSCPYNNFIIQTHSYEHRVNNANFLVRPIKRLISRNKILKQKRLYSSNNGGYKYFCVSNRIKNDYVKNLKLNENKVFVTHLGTKQIFENCPDIEKRERIKFGLVSANSMNKSAYLLIFAMFWLKLAGYKFSTKLIMTKEKKFNPIRLLIGLLGLKNETEIISWQDDMNSFYNEIDCIVLPSLNEAFGLVVLEAMAYAKPAIVSSTTGVSEILDDSNSFVFKRESFLDFIVKVKKVIDLYNKDFEGFKEISRNGFELSKRYSWQDFALNIIHNL